jgi:hypothetical protein
MRQHRLSIDVYTEHNLKLIVGMLNEWVGCCRNPRIVDKDRDFVARKLFVELIVEGWSVSMALREVCLNPFDALITGCFLNLLSDSRTFLLGSGHDYNLVPSLCQIIDKGSPDPVSTASHHSPTIAKTLKPNSRSQVRNQVRQDLVRNRKKSKPPNTTTKHHL